VLMLSGGRVLACGAKAEVLTSARLSQTFGSRVVLRRLAGRYKLEVSRHANSFAR
jgi:ABC-type cobalamin transport system ATPase subunit